jgi:adenylate cyclase
MKQSRFSHYKTIFIANWIWASISFLAVALCIVLQWMSVHSYHIVGDEWTRDKFISWRASAVAEDRIALIDIDEASIGELGAWPWPRQRIADLIELSIGEYQAKGVALDIFFADPKDAEGDQRLANLAQFGPVVLAQALDYYKNRSWPVRIGTLHQTSFPAPAISAQATGYLGNHDLLSQFGNAGNIGYLPDQDGVLRQLPVVSHFEGSYYPTLSLALFECCALTNNKSEVIQKAVNSVNSDGFSRINYSKQLDAYLVVPASHILKRTLPTSALQDKLVIIGSSSLSLSDRVTTPLYYSASGFLVHAEALTTLLDMQEGKNIARWPGALIAILYIFLVAAITTYTLPRYSALFNTLLLLVAALCWLIIANPLTLHDPTFSPNAPLLSLFVLLSIAIPFGWSRSQRRSRRLLGTLEQYVAQSVVKELLRSDLKDPLEPRTLTITTLIADMEAYTQQVSQLSIADSAQLTRDFLECLTQPVLDHGGTLDKYTGDGLVAFWGAPLAIEGHADLAITAAIQMVKNVEAFSLQRQAQGFQTMRVRIGIESGVAIAGDFGSSMRSIYTAVGDSVNVASRLEDTARHFPYDIIIGQGAVELSTEHAFISLGERKLRGKEHATPIYSVSAATNMASNTK